MKIKNLSAVLAMSCIFVMASNAVETAMSCAIAEGVLDPKTGKCISDLDWQLRNQPPGLARTGQQLLN